MLPNNSHLTEKDFFRHLLEETKKAYDLSDVVKLNSKWAYSVCGRPIVRNQGLILGLNWGGGNNEKFQPQDKYPTDEAIDKYSFIIKLAPFLKDHLDVLDSKNINYSNLCFFRSPRVQDLTEKDWDVSKRLILEYIRYVDPAWILFTSTNLGHAKEILKLEEPMLDFTAGTDRIYSAFKSTSTISEKRIPFYALPHPNARLKGEVRKKLWNDVLPIKPPFNGQ